MRQVATRLAWGVRELVWKVDEKVVWPVADAISEDGLRDQPEIRRTQARERWRRYWPDLLLVIVLAAVAVLSRRHGLPTDGLWLDDAQDAAAIKAPLSDLILVGKDHPGYVAILSAWKDLTGGASDSLAAPAFIAGILGPPLLYLGLRALGFARSIGFLLGAALAAAEAHILNSGRVRTFTIDLVVVLGLAVILPRLARIRWTWATAVAWFVGAMLVSSISGFALGAALAAGAIILLHQRSDLAVRAVAVGAQFAATAALYLVEARNYSSDAIETYYRVYWDAFPDFHVNPVSFAGELLLHLRRLAEAFPGGPAWFAVLCGLVAVAGLAAACLPGQRSIAARFLALLLGATVVASLFGKVPFGPSQTGNGYRVSIWLVPVLAVGLAVALQALRRLLVDQRTLRIGFDVAVFAAAAAVLVSAGPAVRYPFPGPRSATQFIEANVGPSDAIILPFHTEWSFAAESRFSVKKMEALPESTVSFDPAEWSDPRIHNIDLDMDPSQVAAAVKGTNRVFVYYPALRTSGLVPPETQTRSKLTALLGSLGLRVQDTVSYEDNNAAVDVLGRGASPNEVNLQASDFPPGWSLIPPTSSPTKGLVGCVGAVPPEDANDSVVAAAAPSQLNAISEVDQWPTTAEASRAVSTLRGPGGARCIRSVLEQMFAAAGLPFAISATQMRPPAAAGAHAAAYDVTALNGGTPEAQGSVVIFSRGRTTAQLVALRAGNMPFSQALVADLTARLAKRSGRG